MSRFYASAEEMNMPFDGAKLALYLGPRLVVILRDMVETIPFPGHWDLPGGGREGDESPVACALRETREELGLDVPIEALVWGRSFREGAKRKWFFVAGLPISAARKVSFGDEGQGWRLMDERSFLEHPRAVPQFQDRLRAYVDSRPPPKNPPLL
ncbi:NUDIX hydrolase [Sulfitobacter sp. D35]|uniref:NUDIX hydrolase n=1 Tax=Sulfitobacter sp. D35 TaxID=3083252 RepID=UPI00296EFC47|nr:NUDIX hydrolase [Sulfitobacter sp. D35]MDW4500074.1 NUDIX hydrolase [Sulfitobacter sp. D35]